MRPFISLIVLLLTQQALAAVPPIGPTWTRGYEKCEALLMNWGDGFFGDEEREDFWGRHPRFGILRKNGRHYLITREEASNLSLQKDLIAWTTSLGETPRSARRLNFKDVPDGVAYDVTNILPARAREFHGRSTSRGNCWNFACFNAGVTEGIFEMIDGEITHWLESPLARKLAPDEAPKPGDIAVFRVTGTAGAFQELHTAVYVSEDLVFSKNGGGEGIFRLQDAREMVYEYGPGMRRATKRPITTELFRLRSLADYVAEHRAELSPALLNARAKFEQVERLQIFYHMDPETETDDAFQIKWRAANKEISNLRVELREIVKKNLAEPAGKSEAELFLWRSMSIRLSSV